MRGVIKILAKEVAELSHRPFLLFWLATVPMLLTLVAGYISTGEPQETLVLSASGMTDEEKGRARQLLDEIAGLTVVEVEEPVTDIIAVMERTRAGLALVGHRKWEVIERSSSRVHHQRLMSLAYQIATSLNLDRPWQLKAIESLSGGGSAATVLSLSPFDRRGETWLVAYVVALLLVLPPFMLTCNSLVREQDTDTLGRLLVVPNVSWISLVVGKALLPLLLGAVELFLLMLLSHLVFDTEGGPAGPTTLAIQFLAVLSSTLLGIAVATVVRSQLQAYLSSALYLVCLVVFTGFAFPLSQALVPIKLTSYLFPLTFSLQPLAAWMLLGTDGVVFVPELQSLLVQCTAYAALAAYGVIVLRARM